MTDKCAFRKSQYHFPNGSEINCKVIAALNYELLNCLSFSFFGPSLDKK